MSHSSTPNIEIFLGKGGETFGPYTVEQFEAMKLQPDFHTYVYIWDGRDSNAQWKPLEAAPPAPVAKKRGPGAPPPDAALKVAPAVAQIPGGYDAPGIEVICHDSRNIVGGRLTQITDAGCELISSQAGAVPGFGTESNVMLNLLDTKTGKSMNVPARLNGMRRQDGAWNYRVTWQGCPQLIAHQLEKSA